MTKTQSTKRALLMSGLAVLLCFTMLIGSTFAWFTDSVTSANNIIKSGNLHVTMEWLDGKTDPTTAADTDWKNAETGAIFNSTLWEPGYTEVRHIKIENEGTLALKYKLNIIANGKVSELADVIDVYYIDPAASAITDRAQLKADDKIGTLTDVLATMSSNASTAVGNLKAGEEIAITLALKMQESAGNKYQDLSIGTDFSIQLLATQYTSETDSFDNQYDANANYGTYIELNTGDDLLAAMASAEKGLPLTIKLLGNVEWPTEGHHGENDITPASSIVIDGNGNTITATGSGVTPWGDTEAPLTLKNMTVIDQSVSYAENAWEFSYLEMGGTILNCVNVDFADPITIESETANFADCSFVGYEDTENNIKMNGVWMHNGDATFTSCTFTGTRGMKICDMYNGGEVGTVVIDGCTFNGLTQKPGVAIDDEDTQDMKITIKNSTFINCQPGDQGLYIYETDNTVPTVANNTVYNNAKVISNAAELIALGNTSIDGEILLTADIDMNGASISSIGAAYGKSLTVIGNGHTISNATLTAGTHNGMNNYGLFYAYTNSTLTINDLVIENITVEAVQSNYGAAVVLGYMDGGSNVTMNNVAVKSSTVKNTYDEAAIFVSYQTGTLALNRCSSTGCTVEGENTTKTGAFVGCANGTATLTDCTTDLTIGACNRVLGTLTVNGGYIPKAASNAEEVSKVLENGGNAVLTQDITTSDVISMNGGELDGNNNTIVSTASNHAITTTGGTVKNLTVRDAFRGIGTHDKITEDLIVDNYTADGGTYALHVGVGNGCDLIVTNSTLNGWTSYGKGFGTVEFTNCKFGKGESDYYAMLRAYSNTTVTGCTFESNANTSMGETYPNFMVETSGEGVTLTLVDCYVGDTLVTPANVAELLCIDGNIVVQNS